MKCAVWGLPQTDGQDHHISDCKPGTLFRGGEEGGGGVLIIPCTSKVLLVSILFFFFFWLRRQLANGVMFHD